MKQMNSVVKLFGFTILLMTIVSCAEDFSSVGSDIIGDPNFEFDLYENASIKAYSRRAYPVQTNNLPVYQLGIYNDPVFGRSEASILTQVTMNETNPTFGENPEIEKVILDIPYFSTAQGTGDDATYALDSIFGQAPFKLSVYESNYYLRDFDPASGFEEPQKYFSNQGPVFQNFLGQLLFEEAEFIPSNGAVILNPDTDDEERLAPRFRVELGLEAINFFKEKILDQEGTDVLLNNTNFKNHLRGLYFIAEATENEGNLSLLDLTEASIEIIYTKDDQSTGGTSGLIPQDPSMEDDRVEDTFTLSFNGITVNTIENNIPSELESALNNPNQNGEENLYLKGGTGTITIIELFGEDLNNNSVSDELEDLREKKWLINEANITLNVNKSLVNGSPSEPERIFLYDLNNNTVLIDYQLDNITPANNLVNFKTNHLGRLQRDASGNGESYRIRVTNHISNLINKDSTNVKLGLVVSQNVNIRTSQSLQNEIPPGIEYAPTNSVISPEGTVLYGTNSSSPDKSIKLNIYYTEINN